MSGFDPAQYDELISKIRSEMEKLPASFNAQVSKIESDFEWIPGVGDAVKDALNEAVRLFNEAMQKLGEFLQWTDVPVRMWSWSDQWSSIATKAGESATQIAALKQYQSEWGGIAGGKYQTAVSNQGPAVDQIQSRANQLAGACSGTAIAGFGFYVSVGIAIVGLAGAIITSETGVGLVVGLVAFLAGVAGALASLLLGVEGQARAFRTANEPSDAFSGPPANAWPRSTTN